MNYILAQVPSNSLEVADLWINKVATWGLSFVFLSCVLLILLWMAVSFVSVVKEWLPKWFQSSIDSHERVAVAVENLSPTLECIHEKTHSVHQGMIHSVRGTNAYINRTKSKYNIGSDVLIHFNNAQDALERGANHVHRLQSDESQDTEGPGTTDKRASPSA